VTVVVTLNQAEIDRVFHSPGGPVFRYVHDLTEQVRNAAVRRAPHDTGALAASIESLVTIYGDRITGRVGSRLGYARYVQEGTGLYGPKHRLIVPVQAKVLAFRPGRMIGPLRRGKKHPSPEKRGPMIFARYVKGSPPNPFLTDALDEVLPGRVQLTLF
jgi:hypothetical protein